MSRLIAVVSGYFRTLGLLAFAHSWRGVGLRKRSANKSLLTPSLPKCRLVLALIGLGMLGMLMSAPSFATIELRFEPEYSYTIANGPGGFFKNAEEAFAAHKAANDVLCWRVSKNLRPGPSLPYGYNVRINGKDNYWVWDLVYYDPNCQEYPGVAAGGWIFMGPVCPVDLGLALQSLGGIERRAWCAKQYKDDCPDCRAVVGNPVNALTGLKTQDETDYVGPGGLAFKRRYTSQDGAFHSQLNNRIGGSSILVDSSQSCWQSLIDLGGVVSWPYCGRLMDTGDFRATYVNGSGRYTNFSGSEAVPTATANINDKLSVIINGSGQREWRIQRDDNSLEIFDATGRIVSKTFHDGRAHTFTYSNASTPLSVAPGPGYLIGQQDSFGRALTWTYNSAGQMITMRDPDNQLYSYAYGEPPTCTPRTCGKLLSVQYPDGAQRKYHWNETGALNDPGTNKRLSGITDELGNRFSTYTYDAYNRVISTEHVGGVNKYTITPASPYSFGASTVVDPLGTSRSYSGYPYNDVYVPTAISQPNVNGVGTSSETSNYDNQGRRYAQKDHLGLRQCWGYDKPRNLEVLRFEGVTSGAYCHDSLDATPLAVNDYLRRISTEWHANWRLVKRVAEPLRITTFVYNGDGGAYCAPATATSNGQPIAVVCSKTVQATTDAKGSLGFSATPDGAPRTTTYTYNPYGQVLTADGPRSDVTDTTYTYDTQGNVATLTNAKGHVTTIPQYDASGRPQKIIDANGLETLLDYFPRGWLKSRATGSAAAGYITTTYDYDGVGQLKRVTLPDLSFLAYDYDGAHRLIRITDTLGNKIDYTLDNIGNRISETSTDPQGALVKAHTRQYDALNRLFKDIGGANPLTQITTLGYDANGNPTSSTDPLARVTTQSYDALNRLTQVVDPFNGAAKPTKYTYNAQDQLTQVTDPKGLNTSYTYNGLGEMLTQTSPDTGLTTFTYDAAGNLKTKTDARNVTATYSYDQLNRITTISYPATGSDAAETVTYSYDTCTNGIGRLCTLSDKSGTTAYTYDLFGRISAKSQSVGAAGNSLTQAISYSYNSAGQLTQITTPSGQALVYSYQNNRPVSLSVNGVTLLSDVTFDPFGPNGGWKWGNSTAAAPNLHLRLYDKDYRVTQVLSDRPQSGTSPVLSKTLAWDSASRINAITDPNSSANSFAYAYDALDRLINATPGAGATTPVLGYSYDGVGNRLTQTATSGTTSTTTYSYPATSHRLQSLAGASSKTYSYDAVGNLISDGTHTWRYGGNNRPTQVTSASTTTQFLINALGQRVKKSSATTSATTNTRFVYDEAGRLQGEYDDSGALIQETVWLEDLPVGVLKPDGAGGVEIYYVHTDQVGSPRAVTRPSDHAIVWKHDNTEPFGNSVPNNNPSGLGNFENNNRGAGQYYDKETNTLHNGFRTLGPDLGRYFQSDPLGQAAGPNTYLHVGGNPLSNSDPSGLACISSNGTTYCSLYPGPLFKIPTPPGFPAQLDPTSLLYHYYMVNRRIECADEGDVMRQLINNPTPGTSKPATPNGTLNNAVVIPGVDNFVTSYLTSDLRTGASVVVNITGPNSQFSPGLVARTVSNGFLNTYGEGLNFAQSPILTSPLMQDFGNWWVWARQSDNLIEKCGCKK